MSDKRVIVTGASSGIGWHLAVQLAESGANVLATARRSERLDDLKAKIESTGGRCETVVGDVTQRDIQQNLLDRCQEIFGGVDILINNAGVGAMGRFDAASEDRLRQIFEVNFFAMAQMCRVAIPVLRNGAQPMIVNIGSVLGHRAAPLKSEYSASKFAAHGFTDSLRAELAGDIDVLLVSPSTTDSEFFDSTLEDETNKDWKKRGSMPANVVAAKTIRAIRKGKHEIILSPGGKFIVWLDRLLPGIANHMVAKFGQ